MMDREKVIKAVEEAFDLVHSDYIGTYDFDETEWEQNKADAIALLKEQEAVVRCKDCKWFNQAFKNEGRCITHDNDYHDPNWYCADGERRDDNA